MTPSNQSAEIGKYLALTILGGVILTLLYILLPLYVKHLAALFASSVPWVSPVLQLLMGIWIGAFLTATFITLSPRGGNVLYPRNSWRSRNIYALWSYGGYSRTVLSDYSDGYRCPRCRDDGGRYDWRYHKPTSAPQGQQVLRFIFCPKDFLWAALF